MSREPNARRINPNRSFAFLKAYVQKNNLHEVSNIAVLITSMALDYKLDDFGWFEFEQLVQTLLKARLGLGLEAWGGWGDWGRDAYFAGTLRYPGNEKTKGDFVFQSKFVESANAAGAQPED